MNAEAVSLIIASIGACIASIIYSLKHIRKSDCCGNSCQQVVEGVNYDSSSKITEV